MPWIRLINIRELGRTWWCFANIYVAMTQYDTLTSVMASVRYTTQSWYLKISHVLYSQTLGEKKDASYFIIYETLR